MHQKHPIALILLPSMEIEGFYYSISAAIEKSLSLKNKTIIVEGENNDAIFEKIKEIKNFQSSNKETDSKVENFQEKACSIREQAKLLIDDVQSKINQSLNIFKDGLKMIDTIGELSSKK